MQKEKLIDLLDEITAAIGQILASHIEMTEGMLGASATLATKKKIAALRARVEAEKVRLAKIKAIEAKRKAAKSGKGKLG